MSGEQRWYVNEAHHRAILAGAQRMTDRLGIEAMGDDVDHQDEMLGALDLIVVLRLELAAQVRALPDRETIANAIRDLDYIVAERPLYLKMADAVLALLKR